MRPRVFVFDAYGTLFDLTAAARLAATEVGGESLAALWPALAPDWRAKQLEYAWLRTLMGAHADFATVTAEALDYVLDAHGLGAERGLRARLLAMYDDLPVFAEVPDMLATLRERGARLAILSNGTPVMLRAATRAAGIDGMFEATLSVEDVGVFKPDARVYAMVEARLGVPPAHVMFVSSNAWDVAGAARFGFTTVWINRTGAPFDRLPHGPAHILPDLSQLPEFV